ncbi:MAG: alpha/beta hydrolase-fold protein [Bacillota bacterium]
MNIEYHKHWSSNLNREMEYKVYGHAGKPIIVFPSSGGSFYEYEDFKMIEASQPYIDAGSIQFFSVSSVDKEMWLSTTHSMEHRAWASTAFDKYITDEFTPIVRERTGYDTFMATGCSMGAYHSLNMWLRHPEIFDEAIALSGRYDLVFGDNSNDVSNETLYYNAPTRYFPNLNDEWYLDKYRHSRVIVCSGQGPWEAETLKETYEMQALFQQKNIPVDIQIWGTDVAHDWPWWRQQMPIFLDKLGYAKVG